jgi:uncharacterized membrane protein
MKIARFFATDGPHLGIVQGQVLWDLVAAAQERGQSWLTPIFTDILLFFVGRRGV